LIFLLSATPKTYFEAPQSQGKSLLPAGLVGGFSSTLDGDVEPPKTVLLAILTDLSTDYRCFKLASTLQDSGYAPIILCDKPKHPLGRAWSKFPVRFMTPVSHLQGFFKAFILFHLHLAWTLLWTRSRLWIALDCPPLLTLAILGKIKGATVVYDSHEIFLETPMVLSRPSRKRFWTFWHDAGLRLVHRILAVSPAAVEWFQSRYPGHAVYLLPNAPLLQLDAPWAKKPVAAVASETPAIRLIYQGGLRAASGLMETFQALRDLPQFTADIYGDGPERANLEAAVQKMGLEKRVRFHGHIPFEALRAPMGEAHIGLHPLQPVCGNFALTLSNKVFDYVHAGLPVLLSENPAHAGLLREHRVGVAVDSYAPDSIAAGLRTLVAEWDGFHAACRQARDAWHWQAYARDLPSFLEASAALPPNQVTGA
jgi:glycosyltransferase involved in cell wall biosynthesis